MVKMVVNEEEEDNELMVVEVVVGEAVERRLREVEGRLRGG